MALTAKKTAQLTVQLRKLEAARRGFSDALRDYEKAGGRYIDRARELPEHLVQDCKVHGNRFDLLGHLPKTGIVAEVGTDKGEFAAKIFAVAQPKELHIFEIDVSRIETSNLQEHVLNGTCRIHPGNSSDMLQSMPPDMFDWVYIDGDHSYEGAMRDLKAAAPKVKKNGLIICNDYNVWSVSSMRRCGVARAVNEFAVRENWKFAHFCFQTSMYCDVALTRHSP